MNRILALAAAALLAAAPPSSVSAVEKGDDGLHKQPWFSYTFKDLAEDVEAAKEAGKRLAVFVEQRGCIYCTKMHEEVYSDPEISKFIADNFMVVQINMFGDEEVTDFDGESLPEKEMVRRWNVLFTPTVLFMPETPPEDGTAAAAARRDHAGRLRQEHRTRHVHLGARKGLRGRRTLPEIPCPHDRGTAGKQLMRKTTKGTGAARDA